MAVLVGANGSRGDWLTVTLDTASRKMRASITPTSALPALGYDVLAIDIPIGLTDSGPREADRLARAFVGPRRNSVFPSPIRSALRCATRSEASAVTQAADGRRVGAQAFGLFPKICQVVDLLLGSEQLAARTYEVHPEVSFTAWAGHPMQHHKRTSSGKVERQELISRALGASVFAELRSGSTTPLPDDDLADALAALWSAGRILRGAAFKLPDDIARDALGFPMNIWY
jgi:predicted RNase H-like nuclease